MVRPLRKNQKLSFSSTVIRIVGIFFLFTLISFAMPNSASAVTKSCNSWANDADVNCRCAKDECRLSMSNEKWYSGITDAITGNSSNTYECFKANTGQAIDVNTAPYVNYSYQNYVEKLKLKRDVNEKFPPVAVDIFSTNLNKQFIPQGSICKATDGVAYWYYPQYFERVMKGTSGTVNSQCANGVKPILVNHDLFGKEVLGVDTFFGCLPASTNGLVAFVLRLGLGLGTMVGVLIVLINLIRIISSSNNPDAVTEARKKMFSGIMTLVGLYLSLTIISVAGLQILDLGSFGGSLLRLFTGG